MLEILTHDRSDDFGAQDVELADVGLAKRGKRALGVGLEAEALLLTRDLREPDQHLVQRGIAILLDDLVAGQHVERLADDVLVHGHVRTSRTTSVPPVKSMPSGRPPRDQHQQEAADDDD